MSSPASRDEDKKNLDPREIAETAARIADEMRARDILILDVRDVLGIADYFVIASGTSRRQLQAIAEEVTHVMKRAGKLRLFMDGYEQGGWILIDFDAVVIHLFTTEARQYYRLEDLWEDAPRLES